eukprot:3246560-Rhodomonas_salina.2
MAASLWGKDEGVFFTQSLCVWHIVSLLGVQEARAQEALRRQHPEHQPKPMMSSAATHFPHVLALGINRPCVSQPNNSLARQRNLLAPKPSTTHKDLLVYTCPVRDARAMSALNIQLDKPLMPALYIHTFWPVEAHVCARCCRHAHERSEMLRRRCSQIKYLFFFLLCTTNLNFRARAHISCTAPPVAFPATPLPTVPHPSFPPRSNPRPSSRKSTSKTGIGETSLEVLQGSEDNADMPELVARPEEIERAGPEPLRDLQRVEDYTEHIPRERFDPRLQGLPAGCGLQASSRPEVVCELAPADQGHSGKHCYLQPAHLLGRKENAESDNMRRRSNVLVMREFAHLESLQVQSEVCRRYPENAKSQVCDLPFHPIVETVEDHRQVRTEHEH